MANSKRRSKQDVKSKKPFSYPVKNKKGKLQKSGVVVEFKDGTTVTLLTPSGKATKFASELGMGVKITNGGEFKHDKNGNEVPLTAEQRSYRAGYLDAQKDNAKAYNAKKSKKAGEF